MIKIKFNIKFYFYLLSYIIIYKMNVSLDLSPAQLSKLRNFKGVRITPAMVGRGVDLIIDPLTFITIWQKN